ncbi:uncharacterized protein LOC131253395 isoform X2 [Magnolia sinica]|uniref:uncharacterized protein LOC131253395 isoform X2 n=1 Tax=Magnolia sinica TaxID=86752 RepID=UPI00265B01EF|nr:uncharacterized protein LOC131253395 isoform X2 [Magnolia sinica]
MMLSLRRLMLQNHPLSSTLKAVASPSSLLTRHEPDHLLPSNPHFQRPSQRFLDIYQMGNKEAIAKERARISDEMNRGYFADISEMKKHGGKIAMANKTIIPAMVAVKFPSLEVNFSNGRSLKLPISSENCEVDTTEMAIPSASLICLSFRASSQVSLIDSWFLSLTLVKKLLLRTMRKSSTDASNYALQRQIVYSFGDHYYFRKELKILNLLTGYVFLLDRFGRIRWQGFGSATQEEVSFLLSSTSLLLEGK